jgi:hypothetical protein
MKNHIVCHHSLSHTRPEETAQKKKKKIRPRGRRKSIKRILRIPCRRNQYDCTSNGCQKATDPQTTTEPALGPVIIMTARAAYLRLDEGVCDRGWHTQLTTNKESIDGLTFFAENCSSFDNSPIRSATRRSLCCQQLGHQIISSRKDL